MVWIWIVAAPVGLILLAWIIGHFLPGRFECTLSRDIDAAPAELYARIGDFRNYPMAGRMTKGVEVLPEREGHAVWQEDIGSSRIRVQTTEAEPECFVRREMSDSVVPMRAEVELRLVPIAGGGTRVTMTNCTTLSSGTWHVPFFRFTITVFGGVRLGVRNYLRALAC